MQLYVYENHDLAIARSSSSRADTIRLRVALNVKFTVTALAGAVLGDPSHLVSDPCSISSLSMSLLNWILEHSIEALCV